MADGLAKARETSAGSIRVRGGQRLAKRPSAASLHQDRLVGFAEQREKALERERTANPGRLKIKGKAVLPYLSGKRPGVHSCDALAKAVKVSPTREREVSYSTGSLTSQRADPDPVPSMNPSPKTARQGAAHSLTMPGRQPTSGGARRADLEQAILAEMAGDPEDVNPERAAKIDEILIARFDGSDCFDNLRLSPPARTELHALDGRLISHEVGRRVGTLPAPQYWILDRAELPAERVEGGV